MTLKCYGSKEIVKKADVGRSVDVVYMDFYEAFDKFLHRRFDHMGSREIYLNGHRIGLTVGSRGGRLFFRLEARD